MEQFQWTDEKVKELIRQNRMVYSDTNVDEYAENLINDFKAKNTAKLSFHIKKLDGSTHPVYVGDTVWLLDVTTGGIKSIVVEEANYNLADGTEIFATEAELHNFVFMHKPMVSRHTIHRIIAGLQPCLALTSLEDIQGAIKSELVTLRSLLK